ncbi:polysaccharide deacetylase family protein [Catellatospora sp. NPDC049609]|uniref:polysaccharide deacetylase family protein n=1 Tax=Catellatospora sp. NPDC049609 TaxID=3155505 RepID=UPI00341D33BB
MILRSLVHPVYRWVTRPVGTVRAVATREPRIVLTFDDGPDPVHTPRVLDALDRHGAAATFFVLMTRARRYPHLVQELLDRGHEVALHGVDHTRLTRLTPAETQRRTAAGKDELEQLIQREVRWFRAPYGAMLPGHKRAVERTGLIPVGWGPFVGDWRDLPEEQLAADGLRDCAQGSIMLVHDAAAGPDDGAPDDAPPPAIDRGKVAELLLAGAAARGWQSRSLGELSSSGRLRRWGWFYR